MPNPLARFVSSIRPKRQRAPLGLRSFLLLAPSLLLGTSLSRQTAADQGKEPGSDVFVSGTQGYHTYRIPSLISTAKGTLLAFCEGRKTGRGDDGDIDLVVRRSTDAGKSWRPMQVVHEEGGAAGVTIGNPCPVLDQATGTMWLSFCRDNNDVFVTSSDDEGLTWTDPRRITADVKRPRWGWYATVPPAVNSTSSTSVGRISGFCRPER